MKSKTIFINPDTLLKYIDTRFSEDGVLFKNSYYESAQKIIDSILLEEIFNDDTELLNEYYNSSKSLKKTLLKNQKMSDFTNKFFVEFSKQNKIPILLNKGQYHELVEFLIAEDLSKEMVLVLDEIHNLFSKHNVSKA